MGAAARVGKRALWDQRIWRIHFYWRNSGLFHEVLLLTRSRRILPSKNPGRNLLFHQFNRTVLFEFRSLSRRIAQALLLQACHRLAKYFTPMLIVSKLIEAGAGGRKQNHIASHRARSGSLSCF